MKKKKKKKKQNLKNDLKGNVTTVESKGKEFRMYKI